jgi:hypothetical protein
VRTWTWASSPTFVSTVGRESRSQSRLEFRYYWPKNCVGDSDEAKISISLGVLVAVDEVAPHLVDETEE